MLEPAAAIVGARALAIRNAEGRIVAAWNVPAETWESLERGSAPHSPARAGEVVDLEVPGGSLVVWTSPYAPFFGDEELRLLNTLGALTGLALDRVRLFQAEHEARLALSVRTSEDELHRARRTRAGHADDDDPRLRLDAPPPCRPARRRPARRRFATRVPADPAHGSTRRAAPRPSRLDADAIDIAPERVDVREQVEEIVEHDRGRPATRSRSTSRRTSRSSTPASSSGS